MAALPPAEPQADMANALAPRITIVLIRILDRRFLS